MKREYVWEATRAYDPRREQPLYRWKFVKIGGRVLDRGRLGCKRGSR